MDEVEELRATVARQAAQVAALVELAKLRGRAVQQLEAGCAVGPTLRRRIDQARERAASLLGGLPTSPCIVCAGTGVLVDPEAMSPQQLRAIRGRVGLRHGWRGPLPLPKFAHLIQISVRMLGYYEAGRRTMPDGRVVRVRIPPRVALLARQADEHAKEPQKYPLHPRWYAQRDAWLARRARFHRRALERQAEQEAPPTAFPPDR